MHLLTSLFFVGILSSALALVIAQILFSSAAIRAALAGDVHPASRENNLVDLRPYLVTTRPSLVVEFRQAA